MVEKPTNFVSRKLLTNFDECGRIHARWFFNNSGLCFKESRFRLTLHVGAWCNGSTTDFDSVSSGSIPLASAKQKGIDF